MVWGVVTVGLFVSGFYGIFDSASPSVFRVDPAQLIVSEVRQGAFEDFIPVRGSVNPRRTVYLDAVEGGRVERLYVEEGAVVEEGQAIVELSNTGLQLDVIAREAEVTEQLNNLRNTRLAFEQNRLRLKSDLVEINYQLKRLGRIRSRNEDLSRQGLLPAQQLEEVLDEHEYYRKRRAIVLETQSIEEPLRRAQIRALEQGVTRLQENLKLARGNLENLTIRAPIRGQLTALDAELGESKSRGQRLGQIDDTDHYKVTAFVDEFYLTRVASGQTADFSLRGQVYAVVLSKVYPEVQDGQFEVDLAFEGKAPEDIRRGQTLQIRLELGEARPALMLPRGGFFQDTGGNWAFVLHPDGTYAEKREIRLGRRNPESLEVLSGLKSGDRVITSSYGAFANVERIDLTP